MAVIDCTVERASYYRVYFEYSVDQNTTLGSSIVSHALKLEQLTDTYDFDTVSTVTISYNVNGLTYSKTSRINIDDKGNTGYTVTLLSGETTVEHDTSTGIGYFTVSVNNTIDSNGWGPGTIRLNERSIDLPVIVLQPSTPSDFTASNNKTDIFPNEPITLSWSKSSGNVTVYFLQRAIKKPNCADWDEWTDWKTTTELSVTDTPYEMSGTYVKYRICAVNGALKSPYIESIAFKICGGINVKINGEWKIATLFIKVSGGWKRAKSILVRTGDGWKPST